MASENLPEKKVDENGIHNIVGLNFKEFISDNNKNIVLCLCSKVSKMCKKFSKILANIGKIFKNFTDINIGITDFNANEFDINFKEHFPQIILLPKNEENNFSIKERFENSFLFDEDFTTKDILRFIDENTKFIYKKKINFKFF